MASDHLRRLFRRFRQAYTRFAEAHALAEMGSYPPALSHQDNHHAEGVAMISSRPLESREPERPSDPLTQAIEALEFYAEQVGDRRSIGVFSRDPLVRDGGDKARTALAALRSTPRLSADAVRELAEVAALAEKATPGPWHPDDESWKEVNDITVWSGPEGEWAECVANMGAPVAEVANRGEGEVSYANAVFIVAARNLFHRHGASLIAARGEATK